MKGRVKEFLAELGTVLSFGYDATVDKSRRARPTNRVASEDEQLNAAQRRKAVATQRDQIRNLPWVAWMARKHIDYVSHFSFRMITDDEDLNEKLEGLMEEWSEPQNCDIARRHCLDELMALHEAGQVIDGDAGFMKAGTALQGIESDRICKAPGKKIEGLSEHGLVLAPGGAVKAYSVCKRKPGGAMEFERLVPWRNMFFAGYFKRFDQTRGISPLLSALNTNQDLYENFEYTLVKTKMHSMLGTQVTRQMPSSDDGWTYDGVNSNTPAGNARVEYSFDLMAGTKVEMEPGDKIEMLESKTPSSEFQSFTEFMMRITFLCLDIPFSIFNSDRSNNNAMRVDIRQYMASAQKKQQKNRRVLNEITRWKLGQWLVEDRITVAEFEKIKWIWQSVGIPIIDPQREIPAYAVEVANGFNSRTNISRERGMDQRQIFRDLEKEEKSISNLKLRGIVIGQPGQQTITTEPTAGPDPVKQSAMEGLIPGEYYYIDDKLVCVPED